MRRALVLILSISIIGFGFAFWLDHLQQETADGYLRALEGVRAAVLAGRMEEARSEERYLHALWQHDAIWLNAVVDHHHTRDISGALGRLSTALELGWREQAILALDMAQDALEEVAQSEQAHWENIL